MVRLKKENVKTKKKKQKQQQKLKKWRTKVAVKKEEEEKNVMTCTNKTNQIKADKEEVKSKHEIIQPKGSTHQKNHSLGIKLIF